MFSERWTKPSVVLCGTQNIKYFEADLVVDYEDGFTNLQTNVIIKHYPWEYMLIFRRPDEA